MPQSIQIVPKYTYPYVETVINDNTQVTSGVSSTRVDPIVTYAFPFVSSKGIDNVFVRKTSYDSFVSTYGNSNYKKYGQPLMMPLAILQKPNTYVWGMRVMPENASYSNAAVSLYYKADATDTGKASKKRFRIKFTSKNLKNIYDVKTFNSKYTELDGEATFNGKHVDDEGYTQAPIMGIRSAGRGKYGDSYSMRISQNSSYEKEYGIKMYDFSILNNEGGLNKIATYTGSVISSPKYDATTLINDILENTNTGDIPVYVVMNEDGVNDVYEAYVDFITELHPLLEKEYDETFDGYVTLFAEEGITDKSLANMVAGTERVPTNVVVGDVKLTDAVSELKKLNNLVSETDSENIIDIDEFDVFFGLKVASTSNIPFISFPSVIPKGGIPADANPDDYTATKDTISFGSVKGVTIGAGDDGYFANPRCVDKFDEPVTPKTVAVDADGDVVTPKKVKVPEVITVVKFVDSSDDSYYKNDGTAESPVYHHYNSSDEKIQRTVITFAPAQSTDEGALEVVADDYTGITFAPAQSTDEGALEVVADDYTGTVTYTVAQSTDEGALQVVADDADPFDAETQIKISDVTGITVNEGDYVTKTTTEFNPLTQIKISDVTGITVTVGDYVTKTTNPFNPSTQVRISDVTGIQVTVGDYVTKTTTTEYEVVTAEFIAAGVEAGTLERVEESVETGETIEVTKYYKEDGTTEATAPVNTAATKYYYADGSLCQTDVTQWTVQDEIDLCYKNAFSGVYDRRILASRRIPVNAFWDANYSYEVKKVMVDLAIARNDAPVFIDTGIDIDSFSAENINALISDYCITEFNNRLVSKNTQHFKVRETPSQKRVDVSITYFLAQQFADHYMNYSTHIPFVKSYAQLSGHIRDTLEPTIEDYEADLKEKLCENNFNYFETLDDNVFQRATQNTSQTIVSDLSEENNVFTLYTIKRLVEQDIQAELYDFSDPTTRERFTAYEQAKFASWTGSRVESFNIVFRVNEWEYDHSILHCYIEVVFRGLQKRAILEIDINKRTFTDTTSEESATTGTVVL